MVLVPDTVNFATLSLAGPTQVVTVLVPGLTATPAPLGNLKYTNPEPPVPPAIVLGISPVPPPPPRTLRSCS